MSYSKVRNMDKTLQKKKGKLVVRHLANAKGGCQYVPDQTFLSLFVQENFKKPFPIRHINVSSRF